MYKKGCFKILDILLPNIIYRVIFPFTCCVYYPTPYVLKDMCRNNINIHVNVYALYPSVYPLGDGDELLLLTPLSLYSSHQ